MLAGCELQVTTVLEALRTCAASSSCASHPVCSALNVQTLRLRTHAGWCMERYHSLSHLAWCAEA